MKVKVDEMIESIEVVKGGHVTHMVVQGMDGHVEKFVMPFDSVPPSLVVVSREGLVKLLSERLTPPQQPLTFDQLKERVGKPVYRKTKDGKGFWAVVSAAEEKWGGDSHERTILLKGTVDPYKFYDPTDAVSKYYDYE